MQTEKSDISGFAFAVTGWIDIRLREMEKHYEKDVKEQIIKQYQPVASTPLDYNNELSLRDKENLFKEIYSIKAWQRLCKFFQSQAQEREIE